MKGLILKDLLNLKKYLKTVVLIIIMYSIIFIPQGNSSILQIMIVIMCSMAVITSISYDEFAKWDKYALTMPITRKEIVLSKYLLMLIFIIVGSMIDLIINIIAGVVLNTLIMEDLLGMTAVSILVGLIFASIVIPLLYKFGMERARMLILLIFLVPTLIIMGGVSLFKYFEIPQPSPENLTGLVNILPYVLPEIVILIVIISYFITMNIYLKKDF